MKKKTTPMQTISDLRKQLRETKATLAKQSDILHRLDAHTLERNASNAVEVDMQKRVRDHLIIDLLYVAEQKEQQAIEQAQYCLMHGWQHDAMPSSITISLRIAKLIKKIAEREAGHPIEYSVPS